MTHLSKLINKFQHFNFNKRTFFTTPSHSGNDFIIKSCKKMLGEKIFQADISEFAEYKGEKNPVESLKLSQNEASKKYHSKSTFFLTNGSTQGILAAMLACLNKDDKVIIDRNCHISVYNGLVLTGAIPIWLLSRYDPNWAVYEPLPIPFIENVIDQNKDAKAFIITNPTYFGILHNIERISKICKKYNIILIVDQAHGALFDPEPRFGNSALNVNADICVQSLHKTACALNPCALLHLSIDSKVDPQHMQNCINLISTTSPSFPLLLNIDLTIDFIFSKSGKQSLQTLYNNLQKFKHNIQKFSNIHIFSSFNDISKIIVKIDGFSGFELSKILMEKFKIEDELANSKCVLFLCGLGTTKEKLKYLEKALIKISKIKNKPNNFEYNKDIYCLPNPIVYKTPFEMKSLKKNSKTFKLSKDWVSQQIVVPYPPAIPILLPGEIIQQWHIDNLDLDKINVLDLSLN